MGGGSNWGLDFLETGLKRLIIWGEGFESEFFQFFFFSLIIYNFVIQQHSI
jgi:hypothetical protein